MSTPKWKAYRGTDYVAAFKYAEDAAAFVGALGGEVRFGHDLTVWREGSEAFPASESFDRAAAIMRDRRTLAIEKSSARSAKRFADFQLEMHKPKMLIINASDPFDRTLTLQTENE